jgi:hypothetical protein
MTQTAPVITGGNRISDGGISACRISHGRISACHISDDCIGMPASGMRGGRPGHAASV